MKFTDVNVGTIVKIKSSLSGGGYYSSNNNRKFTSWDPEHQKPNKGTMQKVAYEYRGYQAHCIGTQTSPNTSYWKVDGWTKDKFRYLAITNHAGMEIVSAGGKPIEVKIKRKRDDLDHVKKRIAELEIELINLRHERSTLSGAVKILEKMKNGEDDVLTAIPEDEMRALLLKNL